MWQPPGGPEGPPELIPVQELTSRLTSRRIRRSIHQEPEDIQNNDTNEILDINVAVSRTVTPRKRGVELPGRDHHVPGLRRVSTSAQNDHPQHGSSWFQNRRCSDEPVRRHYRMANLYDIQYSPRTLLNPLPNEVIPNATEAEDVPRRLSSIRQLEESTNNRSRHEQPNENLALWPLKHSRFSNYNDDYNVISSYPRPQLLPTEISQCSSSEPITDSEIPSLFGTRISNMPSISEYSAIISNNTLSSSNPSSSVVSYAISEPLDEPISSSMLENSDASSISSEMSSSEAISENLYGSERTFGRKFSSGKQNEVVLLDLKKLHASSNSNLPTSTVQARKVANRMISHTRMYKTLDERAVWCFNCGSIPTLPVTGQCGHTRCSKCLKENDTCPCGTPSPTSPCVNTVIQEIIHKMLQHRSGNRVVNSVAPTIEVHQRKSSTCSPSVTVTTRRFGPWSRLRRSSSGFSCTKRSSSIASTPESRLPLTPQARFKRARDLLASGRHRDAATHLARVAASSAPLARLARGLLAQAISALCQSVDPRRLTRELFRAIRLQSAVSWLKPADLECVLCYHTYTNPITTPCGHTYCRTCIERSLDYRKTCALCLRPLDDFNLAATRETEFVSAALAAIDAVSLPAPPDPDVIPIFVCTVAFPSIPCPLFIFDPRYWMMIRRILESGSRKFGMVAYERDRSYSDYGTVLEVCDCVHLEDGRSILSTVGVSRFRVIERDVHDGCDVARIQPLIDVMPTEEVTWELRVMATQISYKALVWLDSMNRAVRAEIEAAFGPMPHFDGEDGWWERADGPRWLWWLIAILPLRSEIKILILSTRSLLKRMMAVTRTLEVMDSEAFINTSNNECDLGTALSSTEEWLERSA